MPRAELADEIGEQRERDAAPPCFARDPELVDEVASPRHRKRRTPTHDFSIHHRDGAGVAKATRIDEVQVCAMSCQVRTAGLD